MPSPTIATTRPSCCRGDPLGLVAGVIGFNLGKWTFLRPGPTCGARRSPVRIVDRQFRVPEARATTSWASAEVGPSPRCAGDRPVDRDHQDCLARLVERPGPRRPGRAGNACSRTSRRLPTRRSDGLHPREYCLHARAGMGLKLFRGGQRPSHPGGLGDEQPRQRMFARLLGRGGNRQQVRDGPGKASTTRSPSSGRPSVKVPVLSKAMASTSASRSERGAALDQHPQPRQPGRRGQNGRGRCQHQPAGAGDDQHRQRRHDINRRRGALTKPAPPSPGVGAQEDQDVAPSTAGRNRLASRSAVRSSGAL